MGATIGNQWRSLPISVRWLIILIIVALVPFALRGLEGQIQSNFQTQFALLTQMNRALIFVVLALGLNIVVGFAGLLDLGYAAFFAIGAYSFGILTYPNHGIGMSFFLAIWLCAAIAAFFGVLVGAPTLRLRGDYLAIVTLAFGEIIPTIVRNLDNIHIQIGDWVIVDSFNLTNGSQGLNPLGRPDFSFIEQVLSLEPGSLRVTIDPVFWFFVIAIMAVLVLFASRRLEISRLGRAWKAIREDETAADFMGVDPVRTKLLAFAIGASFSGLAGVVFASMLNVITPEMFRFQTSITLLIIVILSGLGSVYGVLIGGIVILTFDGIFIAQILPEIIPGELVQSLRWMFFGVGLVLVMIFRPQGLFPIGLRGAQAVIENTTATVSPSTTKETPDDASTIA